MLRPPSHGAGIEAVGRYQSGKMQSIRKNSASEGSEIINIKISGKTVAIRWGFGGTFAFFADSCLRKRMLPGFHEPGLVADVLPEGTRLQLRLSGRRSEDELREIMDIALMNTGAYEVEDAEAQYFIEVESAEMTTT